MVDAEMPTLSRRRPMPLADRRGERPRLLDLFAGAGGAAMGYYRAGFDVVGVDNRPMPRYPFHFIQADAFDVLYALTHGDCWPDQCNPPHDWHLEDFDAIHASPPCQGYIQRNKNLVTRHPKLIEPVREVLLSLGMPYVIENVEGAPLIDPTMLCGTMFGLPLRRHRLFESPGICPILFGPRCRHWGTVASGDFAAVYGFAGKGHRHGPGIRDPKAAAGPLWSEAMGIDWMNRAELSQAIPPAYTEFIGKQLMAYLKAQRP